MRDRKGPSGPFGNDWQVLDITLPAMVEGERANITGVAISGVTVGDEVAGYPHTDFLEHGHFLMAITPTADDTATVSVGNYTTTSTAELVTTLNVEIKKK